jgi:hypothetical protein
MFLFKCSYFKSLLFMLHNTLSCSVTHTHAECLCCAKLVLEKVFAWRNEDRGGAHWLARL